MPQSPISPLSLSAEALPVRVGGVMDANSSLIGGMSPLSSTTTGLKTPGCPVAVVDAMPATPWRWDDGEIAHLLARQSDHGLGRDGYVQRTRGSEIARQLGAIESSTSVIRDDITVLEKGVHTKMIAG